MTLSYLSNTLGSLLRQIANGCEYAVITRDEDIILFDTLQDALNWVKLGEQICKVDESMVSDWYLEKIRIFYANSNN